MEVISRVTFLSQSEAQNLSQDKQGAVEMRGAGAEMRWRPR